jgi:hypothetical protein
MLKCPLIALSLLVVMIFGAWGQGSPGSITLTMGQFTTTGSSAAYYPPSMYWDGNDAAGVSFTISDSGYYTITVPAAIWARTGTTPVPLTLWFDYAPVDHGVDSISGSNFVYEVDNPSCIYLCPFVSYTSLQMYIYAGTHILQLGCLNCGGGVGIYVQNVQLNLVSTSAPPAEPAGSRDPSIQPFRSYNIWNTAIGSGAVWCASTDADCTELNGLSGFVNSGAWSSAIYNASISDPVITARAFFNAWPYLSFSYMSPWNESFAPAAGADHNMDVYDPTKSIIQEGDNCAITSSPYTVVCAPQTQTPACSGANGVGININGMMRVSEIEAQYYPHMLQYTLPLTALKMPKYYWQVAWPQFMIDYFVEGYSGTIQPGATIGIPSTVNINALGLTADGLGVARALQDYGAMPRASGGTGAFILSAEQAAETAAPTQLANIRSDILKMVPVLAILRNQGPNSINGGGTPRVAAQPRINQSICP